MHAVLHRLVSLALVVLFSTTYCAGVTGDQPGVTVFFAVRDRRGNPVSDLPQSEFEVDADHKRRTIMSFSNVRPPVTLVLLVEKSAHLQRLLPAERRASAGFLQRVVREGDLIAVVTFDIHAQLLQDFTGSVRLVDDALRDLAADAEREQRILSGSQRDPIVERHLFDALFVTVEDMLAREAGRRVVVALVDGEDEGSRTRFKDLLERFRRENVACYAVLLADPEIPTHRHFPFDMNRMARDTGGRLINIRNKPNQMEAALGTIIKDLAAQYTVSFVVPSERNSKACGSLRIHSKKGYEVRAPQKYCR